MTTLLDTIKDIVNTSDSQTSACFRLTDQMIEQIYTTGVFHGLFEDKNYGLHDRKNSVYCFIGMLEKLKNIEQ